MNVSQTTRAWVLACVSNLLIVQGISANPPVTLQTETQSVSNLGSNTHLRSRRAPRVCALLTLCCSRAVRGCVPGMEWRVKEPDVPPPVSPRHQVSSSHVSICTVSLTLLSELALCCVSQTPDKWLLLCLCSRFLHPYRIVVLLRGAAAGPAGSCAFLLGWGRRDTGRHGSGRAPRDGLRPSGRVRDEPTREDFCASPASKETKCHPAIPPAGITWRAISEQLLSTSITGMCGLWKLLWWQHYLKWTLIYK